MSNVTTKSFNWEQVRLLIAALIFVAIGIWMVMRGNWFGWVSIVFFGLSIPIIIWQMIAPRSWVIDKKDVIDQSSGQAMNSIKLEIDGQTFDVTDESSLQEISLTPEMREFAANLIQQLDEFRRAAASELLALYNEQWSDTSEPILSESEFCARLVNPTIVVYDEPGSASIYFDPSGMFTDHCINVWIDEGKVADVSIEG